MSSQPAQKLTRGSVVMTATKVLAVFTGYAANVYLARALGPTTYGLFGVVVTVLIWLELVVAEGLPLWVVRNADPEGSLRKSLPGTYIAAQLGVSLALVVVLLVAAPWLATLFGAPESVFLFRLSSVDIPIFGMYSLLLGVLLGAHEFGRHSTATAVYNIAKLSFTLVFVGGLGLAAVGAMAGSISASIAGLVITLVFLAVHPRREAPPVVGGVDAVDLEVAGGVDDDGPATAAVVAGSVAPAVLLLLQALMLAVGLWIVQAMVPGPDAGYFRAASLIATVPIELSAGITWALYAAFSRAHRLDDQVKLRHYMSQTTRLLLVGGTMWAAIVIPTASPLLALLFSPAYAQGALILAVLALGFIVGNIAFTLAPTMIVEGKSRTLVVWTVSLLAAEAALAVGLVRVYGAVGAAVATTVVLALGGLAMLVHVRRTLKFPLGSTLLRVGAAGAIVGLVASVLPVQYPALLIVWYPLLAVLFILLLWVTRVVAWDDIDAVREGLRSPRDDGETRVAACVVAPPVGPSPDITFGIIARQRIPELDRLADEILRLDDARSREIVIGVETRHRDEPCEVADERGVRWIELPERMGLAYNRNRVLDAARGSVLVTIDDDCTPEPGWLAALLGALDDPGVSAASGGVLIPPAGFVGDSISALGFPAGGSAGYETIFTVEPDGTTDNITTCNAAIRVDVLRELGGFDEGLTFGGEDTELAYRLEANGKRIVYASGAVVSHPARTSLRGFATWFFRRGRAKAQFARRVPVWGYVKHRLGSFGRIIEQHLTDPKIVLIVPLLLASLVFQWAGFVAEWLSPTLPPEYPRGGEIDSDERRG